MYVGELGYILPDIISDPIASMTGNQLAPELEKEFKGKHSSPRIQAYVNEVGQRMAKNADRQNIKYTFTALADDKVVNAFALGNGNIYITQALLASLDNEAELAGVLGHEVGHVNKRHINKSIEERLGAALLMDLGKSLIGKKLSDKNKESLGKATDLAFGLVTNGFSRAHESESDDQGVDLSVKAGYDPRGIVGVMQKFQKMEGGKEPKGIELYLRSHPLAKNRVADTSARIAARYPGFGGDLGAARYQMIVHGEAVMGAVGEIWDTIKPYAVPAGIVGASILAGWVLKKLLVRA